MKSSYFFVFRNAALASHARTCVGTAVGWWRRNINRDIRDTTHHHQHHNEQPHALHFFIIHDYSLNTKKL